MSLTDAWKARKLKNGWYFCKLKNGLIHHFEFNDKDFTDLTCHIVPVAEVLAPCDYNHIVELIEKVEKLKNKVEWEIGKNEALEKQLTEAKEGIKKGRKALELMCDSNDELLALLEECGTWMSWAYAELYEYDSEHESKDTENLLTRINTALGENERPDNG